MAASAARAGQSAAETVGSEPSVFVIPVHEEIEDGLYLVLNRALHQAEQRNPKAIVLDMQTLGGKVDSAIKIRDRLVQCPIKTYTFVNDRAISAGAFIALATDVIVMGPNSNIGGALPIGLGINGVSEVEEKFKSVFASEMRKTAKFKGHPPEIAEAFCNPDSVVPGVKEKGKILTLDFDQATSVGLAAFVSPSLEAMLKREGLGSARIERFHLTGTDQVARFLSNPVVAGILLLIGLGGIFLEIKAPGLTAPGVVGVLSLAFYFFGSYLANLSGYMTIICFIIGIVLLLLEIYVIPGFGIVGVAGILLILGSLFFALFNMPPSGFDFTLSRIYTPLLTMVGALLGLVPALWMASRLLPHTPLYGNLRLAPPVPKSAPGNPNPPATSDSPTFQPGLIGVALTDLRPAGIARFDSRRADVTTEGEFIAKDGKVVVHRVEGNRVFVRLA